MQPNTLTQGYNGKIYVKYTTGEKNSFFSQPFQCWDPGFGIDKNQDLGEPYRIRNTAKKTLFFEEEKKNVSNDELLTLANV